MAFIVFILLIAIPASSAKIINQEKNNKLNDKDLEILDIKYENLEITASIYARVSFRTVHVYFFKSKIINGEITKPVLHNVVHIRTERGEMHNVSVPFLSKGYYQITVIIPNYDKLSKEIFIPKSKSISNNQKIIDLSCRCGECYSVGEKYKILFFFVYNYGKDVADAPFKSDIYIKNEKILSKTHLLSIQSNTYGKIYFAIFKHSGNKQDITIHVDSTNKFKETNEKNNWDSYGGRN